MRAQSSAFILHVHNFASNAQSQTFSILIIDVENWPPARKGLIQMAQIFFFVLFNLIGVFAVSWQAEAENNQVWQPLGGIQQIPIWPHEAPDMETISLPPESLKPGKQTILNVTHPTMTIYPPKGKNTGTAIVVFPGGGFRVLAMDLEGTEICDWITGNGITCILLKYRVPGSDDYWDPDCHCRVIPKIRRALQDAQRTVRLVRSRSQTLNVDPNKIGVIGFSSGGFLVAEISNISQPNYSPVDEADKVSSHPNFAIAAYPGHMCYDSGQPKHLNFAITKAAPPTFLVQARDDDVDNVCNSKVYADGLKKAGVPTELHIFDKGGHAFALRKPDLPVGQWPNLAIVWLKKMGML
ncbi:MULTISPECIES: alpha/beta hydrolase [Rhizobium/Agrobacterium group]|uniref:alpha/beta hydrolase n=1 Tax=Rhizobium/Agrobacterium group TaxID=227290 RepID=UPI00191F7CB1|nr:MULTISPECIES: alpha/beta hydrolase [Rhizobium/Agrobacterium group]